MAKEIVNQQTALATIPEFGIMQLAPGELRELIQENLGGEQLRAFDLDRVKIPGGGATTTWTIPTLDGELETKELVGVIVYHKSEKAFWKESFEASGGGTPPDCSGKLEQGIWVGRGSRDETGDLGPHDCATCPHNQFGTAQDGKGAGKACADNMAVCILTPDSLLPKLFVAPPTSAAQLKKFFLRAIGSRARIHSMVVKLTLSKERSKSGIVYCEVRVEVVGHLSGPLLEAMREYSESIRPLLDTKNLTAEAAAEPSGESFSDTYGGYETEPADAAC